MPRLTPGAWSRVRRLRRRTLAISIAVIFAGVGSLLLVTFRQPPSDASRQEQDINAFVNRLTESLPGPQREVVLRIQDDVGSSKSDRSVIWRAQQDLIRSCMRGAGFSYTPVPYRPIRVDLTGGFGPWPTLRPPEEHAVGPDQNANVGDDEQWQAAYSNEGSSVTFDLPGGGQGGAATGGCLGESLRKLYGNDLGTPIRADMIIMNWLPKVVKSAADSAAVKDSLIAWSACMTARGWSADVSTNLPVGALHDDVACRQRDGLPEAYLKAFQLAVANAFESGQEALGEWVSCRDAAIATSIQK